MFLFSWESTTKTYVRVIRGRHRFSMLLLCPAPHVQCQDTFNTARESQLESREEADCEGLDPNGFDFCVGT